MILLRSFLFPFPSCHPYKSGCVARSCRKWRVGGCIMPLNSSRLLWLSSRITGCRCFICVPELCQFYSSLSSEAEKTDWGEVRCGDRQDSHMLLGSWDKLYPSPSVQSCIIVLPCATVPEYLLSCTEWAVGQKANRRSCSLYSFYSTVSTVRKLCLRPWRFSRYGEVHDLDGLYGCPCRLCHGWNSVAEIWFVVECWDQQAHV